MFMFFVQGSRNYEIYTAILKHPGITREQVSSLWCNDGHGHTSMWVRTDINRMIAAGIVKGTKTDWCSERLEVIRKVDIKNYPIYDKEGYRKICRDMPVEDQKRRSRKQYFIKDNPDLDIWLDGIGICFEGPDADYAETMFKLGDDS